MVVYNSQYRKHYKDPRWDEYAVGEYSRKLDYRIGRRSVEHQHQPWSWDSEDEGSEVDQTSSREVERCQTPKENKKKKETSNEKKKGATKDVEKTVRSTAEKKQHRRKEPGKPRKHIERTPKPKTEAGVKTSNDLNTAQNRREPFVSYGWANTGPIGKKYTYNVRARPEEVYPASLRALKRREFDVKRKQIESERKATIEKELLREKFFKHGWVSPTFLTEYQRSYCLHNDEKTDWE